MATEAPQLLRKLDSDSLLNLNERSAKCSVWVVRVANPRLIAYQFQSRGELVKAQKFICNLVGEKSTEYTMGIVPLDFKKPN